MKVRGQHYVWRFYLEAWTVEGRLFCRRAGKVFPAAPRDVAKQRDFYKLRDLTAQDVALVKALAIDPSPGHLKGLHAKLLRTFALIPRLRGLPTGLVSEEEREAIEVAINNAEEDLHGKVEQEGVTYLKKLREGDASFYRNDSDAMDFVYFLCVQYMRTKSRREAFSQAFSPAGGNAVPFDVSRIWNVLTHIFATNMGWSLYADRASFRLVVLENATGRPLIAGDQPVINTLGTNDGTPPTDLEFYYPVTPRIGVVLTQRTDAYPAERMSLTAEDVARLNGQILAASHEMVFSDSEAALQGL